MGERAPPGTFHGGDLDAARNLFPNAPEPWLDLSTGINPVPYPLPTFEASAFQRLPSAFDLLALKRAAATAYGAPGPEHVAAAPGSQILIETLPRLRSASRVAVVEPTYAEHAMAWRRAGHAVETVAEVPTAERFDVVVVVSPNNPDGRIHAADVLVRSASTLAAKGGLLVVDEAFADLEDEGTAGAEFGPSAVRLRSFGKTYGLAGLRLGFALTEPALARRIEAALGPWAVSGPAIAAGLAALPDTAWLGEAAAARARDAARLDRMILRGGGRIVGGTVLFRTATFADGPSLFRRLGEAGIYVRRFPERPAQLRFGLPPDKATWCRLSRVLKPV
ncbi:threonine-phosphate decarboxylase CobD [Methylobacterium haplocladii]|uniref:8-amino-7-oxononanoate synthase n=1 Tax=Methylobacterium haplocladii TaxID=1176176 RepID=A0A512IIW3_9HYPH|nr:threonine-phosphate decarboxylase CobD [Methylobacterium haplocladii]GEO97646.1 threonine-phosphate decarboxylase [Methylobacterium haplocladii]GJD84479.1 Histidinol-phosphate aminotransferase [Methylobacterium haplocladii]GLS57376.1 threonine-phosphate decarboxylase [Methylobacterium haplocladii]